MIKESEALRNMAANLKFRLAELRWTQGDLARELQQEGEDLQAARMRIYRYVNAKTAPHPATLANLAEALSVTVDWLLTSHPKKKRRSA